MVWCLIFCLLGGNGVPNVMKWAHCRVRRILFQASRVTCRTSSRCPIQVPVLAPGISTLRSGLRFRRRTECVCCAVVDSPIAAAVWSAAVRALWRRSRWGSERACRFQPLDPKRSSEFVFQTAPFCGSLVARCVRRILLFPQELTAQECIWHPGEKEITHARPKVRIDDQGVRDV